MNINIFERFTGKTKELDCGCHCQAVIDALKRQELLLREIKMDIATLSAALDTANALTQKIMGEIGELKTAVATAGVTLPPEVEAKVNQLLGNLQAADNLNPDAPAPAAEETATDSTAA